MKNRIKIALLTAILALCLIWIIYWGIVVYIEAVNIIDYSLWATIPTVLVIVIYTFSVKECLNPSQQNNYG
jgi:hypothetical protein